MDLVELEEKEAKPLPIVKKLLFVMLALLSLGLVVGYALGRRAPSE